jgi:FHA domain
MSVETYIGAESPVSSDRTLSTIAAAERAMLEAAHLRQAGAGLLCCPACQQTYLLEALICPRCGKLGFDNEKTANFAGLVKELAAFVKQPVGDAFAMQKTIVFEVNGTRLELPSGSMFVVGRASKVPGDPQPDVNLNAFDAEALGVSRQHVKIVRAHDLTYVSDMGSKNGTFLNTRLLASGTRRILRDRDELRLGHLKIRVRFSTPFSLPTRW